MLIIAYGNPLRSDDALAWRAAEELARKIQPANLEILQRHQLAPELAENLTRCDAVIFLDAAAPQLADTRPGEIRVFEISTQDDPQVAASAFCHQFSPATLLALAARLYHARPRAFCVTLTVENFDAGERLSPVIEAALPDFVGRVEKLIQELMEPRR